MSNVLIGIYHLCGSVQLQIDMYLRELNNGMNSLKD